MRPGWKTSEFWVTFVVATVSLMFTSGVVVEGSTTEKVVGYIVAALVALGYTGVRGSLKKIEAIKDGDNGDSEKPSDPSA